MYAFEPRLLVHHRTKAKLSREQLAVATRISAPSIASYESGHRQPRGPVLIALANALDIDPRELFEEIDDLEAVAP